MELPAEALALLTGLPVVGVPEQGVFLLSVDDDGFPHVCLLCRAQLAAFPTGIDMVVTSRRTRRFLAARGRVTVVVVGGNCAYYCKLRVVDLLDDQWALGVSTEVEDCVTDRSTVPLQGLTYTPDASLEAAEQWSRCRELLSSVADRRAPA